MNWKMLAGSLAVAAAMVGCGSKMSNNDTSNRATLAQPTTITVQVDKPGAQINPAMWGIFFEDINFGADGGLYAQMVKNGMFEFPEGMMGWTIIRPSLAKGDATVMSEGGFKETNPRFVRLVSQANAAMGLTNEGFRGMGVKAGESYDFSAQVRRADGASRVYVEIVGSDGTTLASAPLNNIGGNWAKVGATLTPRDTDANARLTIITEGPGTIDFDMVSLFPQKTWKNRPGGLRADMVRKLADLKPGFLRFPGGCIVEGSDLSKRYQWKNTIGPIEDRKLLINRWNYEFKHRPTPDYYQTFGLGFFEYFQLCEDIGAEPLPIVNCGMACQFNSGEVCKPEDLKIYIQDALDLIEFANGPADSVWGAKRVAMGHREPFNMKMLGIGNEQWGPQYLEHLDAFTKAIKAKHPEIALISDSGPSPSDERFEFLWPRLIGMKSDIVDQHCYANPIWFLSNSTRYDNYDRNGPKVFFGEYAAQSVAIVSTKNRNNLETAISEAAYMTGLERNADVVRMASYAPLFANTEAWQWTPNLIWVDSLNTMPTPNYFVQWMYMHNRGDRVLPVTNNAPVREILPAGRVGVGTNRATAEFKDVRVVSTGSDGKVLMDPSMPPNPISAAGVERRSIPDGVYRGVNLAGDKTWRNYTVSLKARKADGDGPLIITVADDGAGSWAQWILGGWDNKQHGMLTHYAEQDQLLERVPGSLEVNRWYDVKIVLNGSKMDCYLDGQLIQSAQILHHRVPAVFASATRDEKSGDVILKLVNPGDKASAIAIDLRGAGRVNPQGQEIVLAGDRPAAENEIGKPLAVAPGAGPLKGLKPNFRYTLKPHSFTILRIGAEAAAIQTAGAQ